MGRSVVPIASLARRVPEAGRIRIGHKTVNAKGKEVPSALPEFRFTSHDRVAIDQIAALYGGDVKDWADPKASAGQYEVATSAREIRVVLPPDPLGGTPLYELWSGGGCERRCNGVSCTIQQQGPDGPEPVEVDCLCAAKGALACKVTTRLSVILPDVRFAGVWRLDTKSFNAAQELPGMVDLIQEAQASGLQYATLTIKPRQSLRGGQRRTFLVPVLGVSVTVEELTSGAARLHALPDAGPGAVGALGSGDGLPGGAEGLAALPGASDDEVVDAEVVDDPVDVDAGRARIADEVKALASREVLLALQKAGQPTTGNAATRSARLAVWRMNEAGLATPEMVDAVGLAE